MNPGIGRILLVAGALAIASVVGFASHSSAQGSSPVDVIKLAEASQTEQKKRTVAPRQSTPRQATPRQATPRQATQRQATPKREAAPRRTVTPKREAAPRRTVTPKREAAPRRTVTPKREAAPKRTVTPKREATPRRTVTPKREATPKVVSPKEGSPRVGSGGPGLRAIGPRSTGRVSVRGQNFTVWRGSHRVRYGNRWRTFGALSALSVLIIGGSTYYPYAYLSAPEPVCEGETEDGCTLQWQEVETLEGPREFQCVAYCPWQ
jgi:hypothetical protein